MAKEVIATKESLTALVKACESKMDGLKWDAREASKKVVVLTLTNAEPKRIAEAKEAEKRAKSALRKAVAELALLREAVAQA